MLEHIQTICDEDYLFKDILISRKLTARLSIEPYNYSKYNENNDYFEQYDEYIELLHENIFNHISTHLS